MMARKRSNDVTFWEINPVGDRKGGNGGLSRQRQDDYGQMHTSAKRFRYKNFR